MKPINTSFYDFDRIIEGGFVYVDKTAILYEIARPGADGIYYLPRPRRFGKSLMISTLKALFQGRRELFRGLKIEKTDWDWEKEVYPVLHLDMSNAVSANTEQFEWRLAQMIRHQCGLFDLPYDEKAIYIVEFKYGQSAEAALVQCRERRYADAYAADGRRVVYVGVNYDPASRTVDAVRTEPVNLPNLTK